MSQYRSSVTDVFQKAGVDITPLSCILAPVTHFAAIKKTTITSRGGNSYDAAVLVVPLDRFGKMVQEVPFGEESFCDPPSTRNTLVREDNPRTTCDRCELTWEQLRCMYRNTGGKKRPRKEEFGRAFAAVVGTRDNHTVDLARRQYYAYAGGPLDDVELVGLYDAGMYPVNESTIDDIVTFLPDDIANDPKLLRRAYNQWAAVMTSRQ
jgi:hypothetical protein